jgi:hypothetical protein
MLGLLVGGQHPPRRIERRGEMVAAADWLNDAFPSRKNQLEPNSLKQTTLRFLSEDGEGRWRALLDHWEAEKNYERKVTLGQEAERMQGVDPLPEVLEGRFKYLRDQSEAAGVKLRQFRSQLDEWENSLERAERQNNVGEMLRLSTLLLRQQHEVDDEVHWSPAAVEACNRLLTPLRQMVSTLVAAWVPRQSCHNATDVGSFRHRIEKAVGSLKDLGFDTEARSLEEQAQRAIFQVEKRQLFALTLAESDDYPRQPEPSDSTPVRDLVDGIEKGEKLNEAVESARGVLTDLEIQARIGAIKHRQQRLRTALERQRAQLGGLYAADLDSEEALKDALARASRLRHLFVGTRDEREVGDLALQLERVLSDVAAWESCEWGVERLAELLDRQIAQQLAELVAFLESREIDPAWEMAAIYRGLAQARLTSARERSAEWVGRRWKSAEKVAELAANDCVRVERELRDPPAYLAAEDRAQIAQLLEAVAERHSELEDQARHNRVAAWQQPLLALGPVDGLDQSATEALLSTARQPPDALRPDEKAVIAPIEEALTTHLDRMSVDGIMERIERLPPPRQEEILMRLTARLVRAIG